MNTNENTQLINLLSGLLLPEDIKTNWLNDSKLDLVSVFVSLKESGRLSEKVYSDIINHIGKKPALKE
ncbi:hypothetical protein [Priestia flexa]|uniref:hypothetical protein n=1 Tax=Priestia flexa TaxID=86664 RepID=UPI0024916B92|nr:hypothetical protein [Priestia flexa]